MKTSVWLGSTLILLSSQALYAGASCVVAKKLGNSLAIEWVASADVDAADAINQAKQKLLVAALELKITLSAEMETHVTVPYLTGDKNLETKVARQGWRGKYQDAHPQASSDLAHAHMVIVKSQYETLTGKQRTSYGCGYSARSLQEAGEAALTDLQNYSWGWKPEHGYQVVKQHEY